MAADTRGSRWASIRQRLGRPRRRPRPEPRCSNRPETWTRHVLVEADSIEHQLDVALTDGADTPRRVPAAAAVRAHLSCARAAAITRSGRFRRQFDWWRGTSIEQAYRSLHAARIFLIDVLPAAEMEALIPTAMARTGSALHPTDPRRIQFEKLPMLRGSAEKRAELKIATELAYEASDSAHTRIRGFRNTLLSAAAVIAVFLVVFVGMVAWMPSTVPFCFDPNRTTAAVEDVPGPRVCPSGGMPKGPVRAPHPTDVVIIAGLGLLGGALASAVSIRKIDGSTTPYDVPIALAVLKVPSGGLTAVSGMLLVGGAFVPGLSELDSQPQILAYAIVFGYAQQLATRFIDDRAKTLLDSVPSKEAGPIPPTRSAPQPTDASPIDDSDDDGPVT